AYDEPLAVRVVSPFNEPVDGGMLTFSAPLSGASTDPVEKVIEIADGSASTNLNANGTAGNFEVSVDGQGVGYSIDFYLTNLNQVLYAKPDGSPTADCFSWANACSLQKALGEATVPGLEVWVAAGTYTPGSTRSATFELQDGVRLYGGFAGVETARTQRNLVSNPTILSGEIGAAGISDNVYHVVTGSDNVILDGFIVTGGNANSSAGVDNNGGGMLNLAVSPNIANVTFENNAASNYGGGVFNYNNTATFYNVTFSGNSALEGGGMMNLDTTQYLDNVTFANNTSFYGGGGISNHGTLILAYATFRGNHSDNRGGAFYNDGSSTISNTIFWGNSATTANPQIYPGAPRATQISTSVVQGGYPAGTGIITSDPRLGSLADNGGFNQTFALGAGSSAIDAGTDSGCPEADQRGIPRPQPIGGSCDIGAYEYVDDESPVVTSFSLVTPTNSLNIPVSGFTAVDNTAVTGYKITSSADVPQAGDSGWTSSAPQAYTVASEGSYTLYPWVKDATGFVSAVYASPATAVVELTSPVLESFTRLVPAGSPVSADTLIFLAVFSEAVQGVEPADFSVNSTSTAGVTAVNAGAAGSYEVTISGGDLGSFTGDVGLNVSDTFLVRDLAGNAVPTVEPVIDEIYQVDHTAPVVSDLSLDVVLLSSISEIEIQFNKQILDLPGDDTDDDVTNPANYMLLQTGENDLYDTVSCGEGWKEDDVSIQVNSISYDDTSFRATLQVNNGEDLDNGEYRLMLCATTSIVDLTGAPINGGIDVVYDFTIAVRNAQPEILPATGFPVGSVTMLPDQPDSAVYSSTKMVLQIPVLEVEMPIVGVLRDENGWDVSWLGRNVGYLEGSAFPTRPGNSVLTGHVWDAANHPGPFAQIHTLQYGDLIRISAWGRIYSYEVRDTSLVTAGNPGDVFQHEEYDWVTLVTCETYDPLQGEYLFRRIVRGVLVSVK
ncbi:MAG: sortase, partial [Anaerolineales bacterium]|nr:sortase [Anaerolineales bacterium]